MTEDTYSLLDSGNGQKWERFGSYSLMRPCPQAIWHPTKQIRPDGFFSRDESNRWTWHKKIPASWDIVLKGVKLKIAPTDFGHLGVFPEHAMLWSWMERLISPGMKVLNLFAYSGGASLAAALKGAHVCHLDASKGMVDWARENAKYNNLEQAPIRWIVDDAFKFLQREVKRGSCYEGILLDPPTFGRGSKGEVFKIEKDLIPLLQLCKQLLSQKPRFVILSCHTPGLTPIGLSHLFSQIFHHPCEAGEMAIISPDALSVPSGSYVRGVWE